MSRSAHSCQLALSITLAYSIYSPARRAQAAVQALDDEDIEELDAGEAQLVSEDDGVEALDEVEALDAVEALDEVEEIAPGADDVVLAEGASLIESGEVETLDEADLVPEETDAGERTAIHRGEEAPISSFPAAVTPPESFFEDRQVQALARVAQRRQPRDRVAAPSEEEAPLAVLH